MALIYSQSFAGGAGTTMLPTVGAKRVNTWQAGATAPDGTYPECIRTEAVQVVAAAGPAGEAVLDKNGTHYFGSAFEVARIGSLSSSLSPGWWDATKGRLLFSTKFTTIAWDDSPNAILTRVSPDDAASTPIILGFDDVDGVNGGLRLRFSQFGGADYITATQLISRAESENLWQDFEIVWQCGTPNAGFTAVSSDGWVKVYWTNNGGTRTLVYDISGVPLYLNAKFNQTTTGAASGLDATLRNWIQTLGFGHAGFMGPLTKITLYDDNGGTPAVTHNHLPMLGVG